MSLHLVTGYKGASHITAEDVGALNSGTFGAGEYVLDTGKKFSASVLSSNTIRIYDGDLMMQGRHITLKADTYEDITIENGTVGMYRNDLIVVRYTKDSSTGIENAEFAVIKGIEVSANAEDPRHTKGDVLSGDCLLHEMPLYRIPLNGLAVGTPEPLFECAGTIGKGVLNFLGDFDEISTSDDTPDFWYNLGNGFCTVFYLESMAGVASSCAGIVYNNIYNNQLFQFFIDKTAGSVYRRKGSAGTGQFGDWVEMYDEKTVPIQLKTYKGTGNKGEDFPCSITFKFVPKLVIIQGGNFGIWVNGNWMMPVFGEIGVNTYVWNSAELNGKTLTWYMYETSIEAGGQLNRTNENYYAIAIG